MENELAPPERIGFIGLGNMGAPLARRLASAGYRLVVADAAPAAIERFRAETPCEVPSSRRALAQGCRVVITMLPDGHAVREVLLGAEGVASGLAPGSIVIDMTSASPVGTRELGSEMATRNIALIDAPVSGGVGKAIEGTLAIMVGGDSTVIARCRRMLEVFGKLFLTGQTGSGHAMKALNNYLSAAALATAAEAIIAGRKFGLDPAVMIGVLNASTGRNTATEHKFPAFVLPRTFNSGFFLGLMAKDLRLALELANATGAPAALLEKCTELWTRAERELGFRADNTEIVKYLESLTREHHGV